MRTTRQHQLSSNLQLPADFQMCTLCDDHGAVQLINPAQKHSLGKIRESNYAKAMPTGCGYYGNYSSHTHPQSTT